MKKAICLAVFSLVLGLYVYMTSSQKNFTLILSSWPTTLRMHYLKYVLCPEVGFFNGIGQKYFALEYVNAMVLEDNPEVIDLLGLLVPLLASEESGGLREPIPQLSAYILFFSGNVSVMKKVINFYCKDVVTLKSLRLKVRMHAEINPVRFAISQSIFIQESQNQSNCSVDKLR